MQFFHFKDYISVDTLQELQEEYAQATGFAVVTVDSLGEPVTEFSNFSDFCMLIRNNETYCQSCFRSDAYGGLEAARTGRPTVYRCHAGLVDFAVPIIVENQYLGALTAGQTRISGDEASRVEFITRYSDRIGEDKEALDAFNRLPVIRYDKIIASARLMHTMIKNAIRTDATGSLREELRIYRQKLNSQNRVKYGLEKALKDSQIKHLQMQFYPHYLFNVLNTIGSLAFIEKAHRTQELIYLLGDLLRYSIKNGMAGTVDKEVGQIERYIKIHSIQNGGRHACELDVSPEIRECAIPFGILLPFVENSLIHGLAHRKTGGFVKLTGYSADDCIVFEVVDNGSGMSKERLNEILTFNGSIPGTKSTGIGIYNAYQRLVLTYGDGFNLSVKSKAGKGTSVRLRLPKTMEGKGRA